MKEASPANETDAYSNASQQGMKIRQFRIFVQRGMQLILNVAKCGDESPIDLNLVYPLNLSTLEKLHEFKTPQNWG